MSSKPLCTRQDCEEPAVYAVGAWLYSDDESPGWELRSDFLACQHHSETVTPDEVITEEAWAQIEEHGRWHGHATTDRALTRINLVAIGGAVGVER